MIMYMYVNIDYTFNSGVVIAVIVIPSWCVSLINNWWLSILDAEKS